MKKGKRTRQKYKMIGWQGILLFAAIVFMTIAYAQISGILMKIEGGAEAEAQTGVFIADAVSQDTTNGKVNYYTGTILSSNVTLASSTSSVTYEITLYNNSNQDYVYIGELIDENAYSNENIGYTLNGLTKGVTTIAPKASLTFTITFTYIEGADTTDNTLDSIINFRFKELPIIDLSNENETYTLENIYPGYTSAEYEFVVANYTATDTNYVPMTYSFETTIDSPIQAKIYDESGNEVTGDIDLLGDGTTEEHTYTLKIIWDANDTEYEEKIHTCNIKLIAKPTDEKYEDYEIVKEFNVEIKVCNHTYENGICTKCGAECEHNYENAICTICGCRITVEAGEKAEVTAEYTDGTNTAIIPAGFTVSGASTENVISEGLVVYLIDDKTDDEIEAIDWTDGTTVANLQKTYDQFVWIPMPQENINDMYMCQSEDGTKSCKVTVKEVDGEEVAYCTTHSSTAMAGRLYATSTGENYNASLTTQKYTSGSGLREPDTVSGRDGTSYDGSTIYLVQLNGILGTSYASASDLMIDLQDEYNQIVKSVYQNQGFYIGRYETSAMTDSNTNATVKIVAGSDNSTNSNISSVTWYRMYAQQKKYAENKGLTSSIGSAMIQGAAYDQVMKFIDPTTSFVKTTGRVSHDLSAVYQTGGLNYAGTVTYHDVAKNIYDLEGNVSAWTTEAFNTSGRVCRGGGYYEIVSPSVRFFDFPYISDTYFGSVLQLYINCDHTYGEWVVTKAATCTENGTKAITCTKCGAVLPQIPISTVDQLLKMGSNEEITIDGTTYTFSSDANYELQNDITFSASDYGEQYSSAFSNTPTILETQVTNYETANSTSNPYSTYTAPGTGTYKLEVWGAQGGYQSSSYGTGGKGGYSVGTITLNQGDKLYIYIGQKGGYTTDSTVENGITFGYNGGGTSSVYATTGGGATDMRFTAGTWNDSNSLLSRVIVAGGGGRSTRKTKLYI